MSSSSRSEIEHERWRPVPGYEGLYNISDQGRVESMPRKYASGGLRALSSNGQGYQQVGLWKAGENRTWRVHRLVLLAFVGPCPEGMETNHKNGDKTDNRLENLEYVTREENQAHAVEHGLKAQGEDNGMSKLSSGEVRQIRERYSEESVTLVELAEQYYVTPTAISHIIRGEVRIAEGGVISTKNYRQGEGHPSAKLSELQVRKIRDRYAQDSISQLELAEEYGVTQSLISQIVRGEIWEEIP